LKKLSKHEGLQELIEFAKSMIFLGIYDPAVNLRGDWENNVLRRERWKK
jgi:hypothetical protein